MEQYVIGVDIGTGSAKAVAVKYDGKPVATSQIYYTTNSPRPGYSEQDPEIIWSAFVACINEIIAKQKQIPLAVSLSSAMHSLLVVDNKNIAITSLITWEDTRCEKIAEELRQLADAESIYIATGTPIHSMSPLCKIKWIKENEPEIFKNAFKFISIKEFIWHRLFNAYEVDYSIASATGLFNINKLQWNNPSLEFCGIDASKLSKPVTTDFIRNAVSLEIFSILGVDATTNFCIGASDGCLANLGSNAILPGMAALTIGTSGAVRIASKQPIINYAAMIFNYILDETTFISGGPVNNGGNVLQWLFKTFLKNDKPSENDFANIFKTIETVAAGCEGLLFLPYLYGERAPVWDGSASGVFIGIRAFHTSHHFLRAAVEGICFSLKNILERIDVPATPIKQLHVSGGFVHSKVWMQILSDITGKKLFLVQSEDASSVGAALISMKALKIINDYNSLAEHSYSGVTPIDHNTIIYKKYFEVFKKMYSPLKSAMHELHEINNNPPV